MTTEKPPTTEHVVTTERRPGQRPRSVEFRGVCSCGDTSVWYTTAGMVSGWEGHHCER